MPHTFFLFSFSSTPSLKNLFHSLPVKGISSLYTAKWSVCKMFHQGRVREWENCEWNIMQISIVYNEKQILLHEHNSFSSPAALRVYFPFFSFNPPSLRAHFTIYYRLFFLPSLLDIFNMHTMLCVLSSLSLSLGTWMRKKFHARLEMEFYYTFTLTM